MKSKWEQTGIERTLKPVSKEKICVTEIEDSHVFASQFFQFLVLKFPNFVFCLHNADYNFNLETKILPIYS